MSIKTSTLCFILFSSAIGVFSMNSEVKRKYIYNVIRLKQSMSIDADWDKPQWKSIQAIELNNYMGEKPAYKPAAQAKMMYDDNNIYVIFHVKERFIRCVTNSINGSVSNDSCIELFFSPDTTFPLKYFNLETNCGGTALMHYNIVPRKEVKKLDVEDIRKIEIAHSLPQIIDPEIKDEATWTLEYRLPIEVLRKYSKVTQPGPGIKWKANFYKIADKTSNPHYLTWSFVNNIKPDFHLPQFFGILRFE
jgi:hypothetical protein